ncbi:MAG: PLP-dependent aspartate aminotransferase family protein [Vicinamibacterales bacterium]
MRHRSLDDLGPLGFSSIAVHAGERLPDVETRAVVSPISLSVGYEAPSAAALEAVLDNTLPGYCYSRFGNPTNAALEETVRRLEGGAAAVAFASGMAAIHGALLAAGVKAGDTVVSGRDIYGATQSLFREVFEPLGVRTYMADQGNLDAFRALVSEVRPRVVFVESISNPLLRVADVPAIVALARDASAAVVVDATFATPRLVRPLSLGADVVVHSSTKYLNGHGDVTGGIVVCRDTDTAQKLRRVSKLAGAVLGPTEAYLTLRGLKTLSLRFQQQCRSAAAIAARFEHHPAVERVHYPGLASHRDFKIAERLFGGALFGAVVSIELRGAGREEVFAFMDRLRLCVVAPTVGDIYTEILYPRIASHRDLTPAERGALGIGDNLVRISVGIEEPEDLIRDLEQALAGAGAGRAVSIGIRPPG